MRPPVTPRWVASLAEIVRWTQEARDEFFRTGKRPEHRS